MIATFYSNYADVTGGTADMAWPCPSASTATSIPLFDWIEPIAQQTDEDLARITAELSRASIVQPQEYLCASRKPPCVKRPVLRARGWAGEPGLGTKNFAKR